MNTCSNINQCCDDQRCYCSEIEDKIGNKLFELYDTVSGETVAFTNVHLRTGMIMRGKDMIDWEGEQQQGGGVIRTRSQRSVSIYRIRIRENPYFKGRHLRVESQGTPWVFELIH